jgi:hypothetical protein
MKALTKEQSKFISSHINSMLIWRRMAERLLEQGLNRDNLPEYDRLAGWARQAEDALISIGVTFASRKEG